MLPPLPNKNSPAAFISFVHLDEAGTHSASGEKSCGLLRCVFLNAHVLAVVSGKPQAQLTLNTREPNKVLGVPDFKTPMVLLGMDAQSGPRFAFSKACVLAATLKKRWFPLESLNPPAKRVPQSKTRPKITLLRTSCFVPCGNAQILSLQALPLVGFVQALLDPCLS